MKYHDPENDHSNSELDQHLEQLTLLARTLASEVETLQVELERDAGLNKPIYFGNGGIDFYHEVESYEIELIKTALSYCGGNQTHAAKLLQMKSTTLNAKMKHYGLNPVRSIALQRSHSK